MVLELKTIQSGMLHKVCSEETEAQAEKRCTLDWQGWDDLLCPILKADSVV